MPMPEDNVNHSTVKYITSFELFAPIFVPSRAYHVINIIALKFFTFLRTILKCNICFNTKKAFFVFQSSFPLLIQSPVGGTFTFCTIAVYLLE